MMKPDTCLRAERVEMFQQYLSGAMPHQEQEEWEAHYFECADCLDTLESHRAILVAVKQLGPATNAKFVWTGRAKFVWTGVAAAAMLALGVSLARHTPQIARPVTSAPVELPVAAAFAPGADAMSTTDARARAVAEFARFEPPAYRGGTSRAVSTDTMRQFRWAMSAYQSGDFAAAARGLHPLAGAGPGAAEARFFLGISELQLGHTDQGIAELRAVARLGDTSYLEEANYFLSKALLSKQDVQEAERTLDDLVRIGGDREHDAQALLQKVRDLRAR